MKQLLRCPACDSEDVAFSYVGFTTRRPNEDRNWNVFRCPGCGHGFMNPQPSWKELEPYYTADYEAYEPSHGADEANDSQTIAMAVRTGELRHIPLPRNKRLLDVGCGGGWFLRIAKQLGAQVIGIEPSPHGAQCARSHGLDVFHGTLDEYLHSQDKENGPGGFDVITSSHVLEHVPEPVSTLRNMSSLLAPGGVIWISVPNASCFFSRRLNSHWHSTDLPYHLQLFSPEGLAKAGEKAGLVVQRQYTYSLPSATAASLRLYLRKVFFVPQKITSRIRLIESSLAPWLAGKMDRGGNGEAIITEFTMPG